MFSQSPRKDRVHLTQDQREEIMKLFEEGASTTYLTEKFNVSTRTVQKCVANVRRFPETVKIPVDNRTVEFTQLKDNEKEEIRKSAEEGVPIARLMNQFNVSAITIEKCIAHESKPSSEVSPLLTHTRSRNCITLQKKMDIIKMFKQGVSKTELASKFNVATRTVQRLLQTETTINAALQMYSPFDSSRKSLKSSPVSGLEDALISWLMDQNDIVSGPVLQAKAKDIAEKMGISSFRASSGWLRGFKKRHGFLIKYPDCDQSDGTFETYPSEYVETETADMELANSFMERSECLASTSNDVSAKTPIKVKFEMDLCRFCGDETSFDSSCNLYDPNMMIECKMERVFNLKFEKNDHLPQRICIQCFGSLENSLTFLETVEKTQENLMKNLEGFLAKNNGDKNDESFQHIIPTIKIEETHVEECNMEIADDIDNYLPPVLPVRQVRATPQKALGSTASKKRISKPRTSSAMMLTRNPVLTMEDIFAKELNEGVFETAPEMLYEVNDDEKNIDGTLNNSGIQKLIERGWYNYSWRCVECNIVHETRTAFEEHFRADHKYKPVTYACMDCGVIFKSFYGFHNHVVERHRPYKKFFCDLCNEFRWNLVSLYKHREEHHSSLKPTCLYCGKIYTYCFILKQHISAHRSFDDSEMFCCDLCDYRSHTKFLINQHMVTKHIQQEHICELCGKAFKRLSDMKNHLSVHTQERPHQCDLCDRNFKTRQMLRIHKKYHFPKKEQCSVCGKKFWRKAHLNKHFIIHTDDFRYSCDVCGKQFKHASGFTTHKRIHTGERPYTCRYEGCDQTFIDYANMSKHMKAKHNYVPPKRQISPHYGGLE